ncbi:hypothetical protein ACXWR7_13455, partial [Streptococcus pyogenes]
FFPPFLSLFSSSSPPLSSLSLPPFLLFPPFPFSSFLFFSPSSSFFPFFSSPSLPSLFSSFPPLSSSFSLFPSSSLPF